MTFGHSSNVLTISLFCFSSAKLQWALGRRRRFDSRVDRVHLGGGSELVMLVSPSLPPQALKPLPLLSVTYRRVNVVKVPSINDNNSLTMHTVSSWKRRNSVRAPCPSSVDVCVWRVCDWSVDVVCVCVLQDEVDSQSPVLRDNHQLHEEVRGWLKDQKVQEIFMQGKLLSIFPRLSSVDHQSSFPCEEPPPITP